MTTPRHSVSVAAIITDDDGCVLVIRRSDNGRSEMPGGVLELDESFEDGVRREVAEETGLHIEVGGLSGVYKNVTRGIVALVFRCKATAGTPRATAEAAEVRWMTPDEIQQLMDPAFAVRVSDALQTGTQHRTHDGVHLRDQSAGVEAGD